jgi:hypothetical protein
MYKVEVTRSFSRGFTNIEEELNFINKKLKPFSNQNQSQLSFFQLPVFMADAEAYETKKLRKKYLTQRKHIAQIYCKNVNFSETCLRTQVH